MTQSIESVKEWRRKGDPADALEALSAVDFLLARVEELEGALRGILEAQGAIYNTIDDQFEGVMAAVDKAEAILTTTEEAQGEE